MEVRFERWALENFIEALNNSQMIGYDGCDNIYHLAFSYKEYEPGKAELMSTIKMGGDDDDDESDDGSTDSE